MSNKCSWTQIEAANDSVPTTNTIYSGTFSQTKPNQITCNDDTSSKYIDVFFSKPLSVTNWADARKAQSVSPNYGDPMQTCFPIYLRGSETTMDGLFGGRINKNDSKCPKDAVRKIKINNISTRL